MQRKTIRSSFNCPFIFPSCYATRITRKEGTLNWPADWELYWCWGRRRRLRMQRKTITSHFNSPFILSFLLCNTNYLAWGKTNLTYWLTASFMFRPAKEVENAEETITSFFHCPFILPSCYATLITRPEGKFIWHTDWRRYWCSAVEADEGEGRECRRNYYKFFLLFFYSILLVTQH